MERAQRQDQEDHAETGSAGGRVILNGRFEIFPDQPLPQFDSPDSPAFNAVDLRGLSRPLFALICRTDHAPRIDTIPTLMHLQQLAMLVPVEAAEIDWPPAGVRRGVLLFEQPFGQRLVSDLSERFTPWREDHIIDGVLKALAPTMMELNDRFVTHRAIRPDNVFLSGPLGHELMLGECVSSQPGYYQHAICEPIDSAIAMPGGRGDGAVWDDLYALGVLILFLLHGGNPLEGWSDEEIIESKILRGSYATLTGPMRASLPMVEVLRGLLCDDPDERWTVDDILLWLNGRHLSPKQPMLPRKAARGFQFCDQSYWTAPMLSYALGRNWDEALRLARNGSIELWVRRSLADDDIAEAIAMAVEVSMAEGAEGDTDHILLSMILMALDPKAPIRYRDFSARIDGMHKAFALCFADSYLSDLYLEVIKGRLPQFWFRIQAKSRPEHLHLRRVFDSARRTLVRLRAGFAAERILYMTNPGWPCQSSLLARDYVSEIGEILTALDRLIAKGEMHEHTVDPHIVAFCAANHKRMPEAIVMGLHHEEDAAKYALYVLQLFGEVQRAFGPAKVRTLVRWCAEMVGPVIETYHNRQIRERLTYGIPAVVEEGSIVSLLYLVDDIDLRETDTKGFEEAQARFARYAQQIGWIKSGGTAHPAFIKRMARPVASVATAVLSSLVVLAMAMAYAA